MEFYWIAAHKSRKIMTQECIECMWLFRAVMLFFISTYENFLFSTIYTNTDKQFMTINSINQIKLNHVKYLFKEFFHTHTFVRHKNDYVVRKQQIKKTHGHGKGGTCIKIYRNAILRDRRSRRMFY